MDTNSQLTLAAAFLIGLGSSFHCLGMCGGIVSALSLSLPDTARSSSSRLLLLMSAFNFGRIASYSVIGGLFGFFVTLLPLSGGNSFLYFVLQALAATFLICLGIHVSGYLPGLKKIESIGLRLWSYIQPLGKRFIPVTTAEKAFTLGAIWGWLPCGLVYSVLLWASTANSPLLSALYMLMFGLGTMPALLITGFSGGKVLTLASSVKLRKIAGAIIVMIGLSLFYFHTTAAFFSEQTIHQGHH